MTTHDTALVTGATGFLGAALVEALLARGMRVIGIGRQERGFLSPRVLTHPHWSFVRTDLAAGMPDAFARKRIATVFHLAAQQPAGGVEWDAFLRGNVTTTQAVLAFVKAQRIPQCIVSSTLSVYGEDPGTVLSETIAPLPTSAYGLTKYIAERLIAIEHVGDGVQRTIVRFPSLFGAQHLGGMVYAYYDAARTGRVIEVYDSGRRLRNALHVADAVAILLQCAERRHVLAPFEMFHAGSADALPMLRIATIINEQLGARSEVRPVPTPSARPWDMRVSIERARRVLGFQPMTLEAGLTKYVEHMATV